MIIDHDLNGAPITCDMRPWQESSALKNMDTRRIAFMHGANVGKTESLIVRYGDKVDPADPQFPRHLKYLAEYRQKRMIRVEDDDDMLLKYLIADTQITEHLRMLGEVARKPVNHLPRVKWLTMRVHAALGKWP